MGKIKWPKNVTINLYGHNNAASILQHLLYKTINDIFEAFIHESFQFVLAKKKITIKMDKLNQYVDGAILDSIFGERGYKVYCYGERYAHLKDKLDTVQTDKFIIPDDGDNTNILRLDLLKKFKNLESISIEDLQTREGNYWPFSMLSFLSILSSTKIKKVSLSGKCSDPEKDRYSDILGSYDGGEDGYCWLGAPFKDQDISTRWKNMVLTKQAYGDKGFDIRYNPNTPETEECILISRM